MLDDKDVAFVLEDKIINKNKSQDLKAWSAIVQCLTDKYLEWVKGNFSLFR